MLNIILLGPPGSGKGTQAEKLIQKYNLTTIALGTLFRKKIAENDADKPLLEQYINNGQMIPHNLSCKLLTQQVAQYPGQSLLFDGFPRTNLQATFLDNLLAQHQTKINGVIFLDVPQETLLKRLKNRAMIEARADDQDEHKIKTRMQIYEEQTLPIVTYYSVQQKLYRVDGAQSTDQVEKAIDTIISRLRK